MTTRETPAHIVTPLTSDTPAIEVANRAPAHWMIEVEFDPEEVKRCGRLHARARGLHPLHQAGGPGVGRPRGQAQGRGTAARVGLSREPLARRFARQGFAMSSHTLSAWTSRSEGSRQRRYRRRAVESPIRVRRCPRRVARLGQILQAARARSNRRIRSGVYRLLRSRATANSAPRRRESTRLSLHQDRGSMVMGAFVSTLLLRCPDRGGRLLTFVIEPPNSNGRSHVVTGWESDDEERTRYDRPGGRMRIR